MNKPERIKAISDQVQHRYGATIFTFDCVATTAFAVDGQLFVMANSKLPRAKRTKEISDVIDRYRSGQRTEVAK